MWPSSPSSGSSSLSLTTTWTTTPSTWTTTATIRELVTHRGTTVLCSAIPLRKSVKSTLEALSIHLQTIYDRNPPNSMTVKDEMAAHTGEEGPESVLVDRVEFAERVMEDGIHGYFHVLSRTFNVRDGRYQNLGTARLLLLELRPTRSQ
ncbi:hypothetical protein K466DRAFT_654574 [Polyporus arcularius HHB13444]|uniref:Uncharacterized protein n=1 Tax=Polyporus arcularius HHB13444 TaxID=1314778 RepID=A0A5C3P745_9APHY|nr:hypothetical protein K466DRAFT_654574 [Polyporus arcularius HHB13444]